MTIFGIFKSKQQENKIASRKKERSRGNKMADQKSQKRQNGISNIE